MTKKVQATQHHYSTLGWDLWWNPNDYLKKRRKAENDGMFERWDELIFLQIGKQKSLCQTISQSIIFITWVQRVYTVHWIIVVGQKNHKMKSSSAPCLGDTIWWWLWSYHELRWLPLFLSWVPITTTTTSSFKKNCDTFQ